MESNAGTIIALFPNINPDSSWQSSSDYKVELSDMHYCFNCIGQTLGGSERCCNRSPQALAASTEVHGRSEFVEFDGRGCEFLIDCLLSSSEMQELMRSGRPKSLHTRL